MPTSEQGSTELGLTLSVFEIALFTVGAFFAGYWSVAVGLSAGLAMIWIVATAILTRLGQSRAFMAGAFIILGPHVGLLASLALIAAFIGIRGGLRSHRLDSALLVAVGVTGALNLPWLAGVFACAGILNFGAERTDSLLLAFATILCLVIPEPLPVAMATLVCLSVLRRNQIVTEIEQHDRETQQIFLAMLRRSHPYTRGHANRVAEMARNVGRALGLPTPRIRQLEMAAVLHDVGKITINEDILDLPRRLTDREFEHVRDHAANGGDILAPLSGHEEMAHWIRCHHERTDGKGYPSGLRDENVPLESRIISVIDAFDAMIGGDSPEEKRSYRTPMSNAAALQELRRCAGSQFDRRVVEAFERTALKTGANL